MSVRVKINNYGKEPAFLLKILWLARSYFARIFADKCFPSAGFFPWFWLIGRTGDAAQDLMLKMMADGYGERIRRVIGLDLLVQAEECLQHFPNLLLF